MSSHNSKPRSETRVRTVQLESDQDEVQVITTDLLQVDELTISDEQDFGADPYNSTGQHAILNSKFDLGD